MSENQPKENNASHTEIRIHFVRYGFNMDHKRIKTLAEKAEKRGATIIKTFQKPPPKPKRRRLIWGASDETPPILPTHLVIEEECSAFGVAEKLKFYDEEKLEEYLTEVSVGWQHSCRCQPKHYSNFQYFYFLFCQHKIECAVPEWVMNGTKPLQASLNRDQRWHKIACVTRVRLLRVAVEYSIN